MFANLHCRYVNGQHYSRTLEDWLKLHDAAKAQIMPLFEKVGGCGYVVIQSCLMSALRWREAWC